MTARFIVESSYVVETLQTDFAGSRTTRKIVLPSKNVDFAISRYINYDHYYDIVVKEDTNVLDSGTRITIINVPKSHITIANKSNKKEKEG
jgi:hypothetical protein